MNPQPKPEPDTTQTLGRQPDAIIGELWEIKRAINREAGYDIAVLVEKACEVARVFDENAERPH